MTWYFRCLSLCICLLTFVPTLGYVDINVFTRTRSKPGARYQTTKDGISIPGVDLGFESDSHHEGLEHVELRLSLLCPCLLYVTPPVTVGPPTSVVRLLDDRVLWTLGECRVINLSRYDFGPTLCRGRDLLRSSVVSYSPPSSYRRVGPGLFRVREAIPVTDVSDPLRNP